MASPIFASSPGILVTAADFSAAAPLGPVVLLPISYISTIGNQIVVKDGAGLASAGTPITVSTMTGVAYTRDISSTVISSIRITRPGDTVAIAAMTPYVYKVLDSREFPDTSAPFSIKPSYERISTISTYTLDALSSLQLRSLDPLNKFRFINAVTASAEFTSTLVNTITATNTLYSADTRGVYNYHSTGALSTNTLNVTDATIGGPYQMRSMTVLGHMDVCGSVAVGAHYSTVVGGLIGGPVPFRAGSNIRVLDGFSTIADFYSGGSVDVSGGFIIGGHVSTGQLASAGLATHKSTVYVSSALTVAGSLALGSGGALTSSLAAGKTTGPIYALDISGRFLGTGAFIDAGTYSTSLLSTTGFTASTVALNNATPGVFRPLYTSNSPSKLYYDGTEIVASGLNVDQKVQQMTVSSFVSAAALFVSSAYIGGSNYASPFQLEVNGGIRITDGQTARLYVAGGSNNTTTGIGTLKWSSNGGLTWNNNVTGGFSNSTAGGAGQGVAWNGRTWVAVGHTDLGQRSTIQYSADGSNWTAAASGGFGTAGGSNANTDGHGVAWNGSLWVAVGSYGNDITPLNSILYSGDGSNWSNAASGGFQGDGSTNSTGFDVAWNGRMWIAVGRDSTAAARIQYSMDGSNWTNSASGAFAGTGNFGRGLAWNGNYWVAVGKDTTAANNIKYSYDGSNWSNAVSGAFNTEGSAVCWNGQAWFATGRDTTSSNNTIKYSYDGRNWSNITSGGFSNTAATGGIHIAYDGTKLLAAGFGTTTTSNMKYSYNGFNWFDAGGSFTTAGFALAYGADLNPRLRIDGMDIYNDAPNPFLRSTNTIYAQTAAFNTNATQSTNMVLNNTVYINPPNGVGINIDGVSSLAVALYVYGSTYTNNPNPVKLTGGSWTSVSDSNWKETVYTTPEEIYASTVVYMSSIVPKEFNYKKTFAQPYINPMAIEKRNMVVGTKALANNRATLTSEQELAITTLKKIKGKQDITSYSGVLKEIADEKDMMREVGFLSEDVLKSYASAVEPIYVGGTRYEGINYDQLNMIHLATTHHLMSTIEIQTSTIQGQEEEMAKIFKNFETLKTKIDSLGG